VAGGGRAVLPTVGLVCAVSPPRRAGGGARPSPLPTVRTSASSAQRATEFRSLAAPPGVCEKRSCGHDDGHGACRI